MSPSTKNTSGSSTTSAPSSQQTHDEQKPIDNRTWPQKSTIDGAGHVVTDSVDAMSNGFIRAFKGKEAAKADRERTQALKQGRKEWQAQQPRFKGSVAKHIAAKKEKEVAAGAA